MEKEDMNIEEGASSNKGENSEIEAMAYFQKNPIIPIQAMMKTTNKRQMN